MHVDIVVHDPDGMSEPLQAIELLPFARLSFIDLKLNIFTDVVGPSTQDKHESSNEESGVLISGERFFAAWLIGGLHPIPSAVSVASKAPSILEGALICSTPAKNYHHASG